MIPSVVDLRLDALSQRVARVLEIAGHRLRAGHVDDVVAQKRVE